MLAIGLPHEIAHGSLRLTLNEEIEKEDIDYVVDNLKEIVAHLREMSPLYEELYQKTEITETGIKNQIKDIKGVIEICIQKK